MSEYEYYDNADLEAMTGIPKGTWRYWHSVGQGPASLKIGRKRVYRKSVVHAWLDSLEKASA